MSAIITPANSGYGAAQNGLSLISARRRPFPLIGWAAALATIDIAGTALVAGASFRLCGPPYGDDIAQLRTAFIYFTFAWIVNSWAQDLYACKVLLAGARRHTLRGLTTCIPAFGTVLFAYITLDWIPIDSRAWLLTWALGSSLWIVGTRLLWTYWLRASLRRGSCLERALVVADSRVHARQLGDEIESQSRGEIAVVGAVGFPGMPDGVSIDWVEETIRGGAVDRVVITRIENAIAQSEALLARLMQVAVDVTVIPDIRELRASVRNADCIGGLPALGLAARPVTAVQAAMKRAEDLVLCCLLGLVVAPVAVIIAIAIRIDSPGPVLFGQMREGYHGRTFRIWKFRTMYHQGRGERDIVQTSRSDSRVTRVGRILRRLSLDEVPQLINVLNGEMSIVGPRPHALGMKCLGLSMTEVSANYAARHRLKPGITGLAQVNGCRGEVDSHEKLLKRVELDCYYIDNWSILFDVSILIRTIACFLFDSGAY